MGYLARDTRRGGIDMDIDKLLHASICLDIALEAAEDGDEERMKEFIQKCLDDLGVE